MKKSNLARRNRKKESSPAELAAWALAWLLDMIVSVYMALILLVMPFYNQEGFIHIGTDKSTFLRICSVRTAIVLIPVLLPYLAAEAAARRQQGSLKAALKNIRPSVTECFALMYGVSVLLACACSAYRGKIWRGEDGWYMGTVTQLLFVGTYFMVSRLWRRKDWLVILVLPVSAVVFLLGFLNRFGIYPIDMQSTHVQFISTIGNINWYCGYMMSVFFGGYAMLWQAERMKQWQKLLLMAYVAVGFASLVTQGSSSGILTLLVVFLAAFCLSASNGKRMCAFWLELLIFSAVCLLIRLVRLAGWAEITYLEASTEFFTNSLFPIVMTAVSAAVLIWLRDREKKGRYPREIFHAFAVTAGVGAAVLLVAFTVLLLANTVSGGFITDMTSASVNEVLTFSPSWGSNRGATWAAGFLCFMEQDFLHKLVGVGADGMASFLYTDGSVRVRELVIERFGTDRLTNAHNEWLTVLVNMGLFGIVGYAGMMATAIRRFLGQRGKEMVAAACGFCILAYTANNMFSFQQAMSTSTIFIILGIGENYLRGEKKFYTH